jgi:hypothetical protein
MVFRKKWRSATRNKFSWTSVAIGRYRNKCQDTWPMERALARDQQPEFVDVAFGTSACMQKVAINA